MNLEQGTVVDGRFSLEALLGEGGMGSVWSARHVVTGKRVALKVLKATSPELHRRLIREARVAAAVRHPNLVEVHDVLELEGESPILVMDLLEGETLASLLELLTRAQHVARAQLGGWNAACGPYQPSHRCMLVSTRAQYLELQLSE